MRRRRRRPKRTQGRRNTARYVARPIAPLLAGIALRGSLGAPFLLAGTLKCVYDLGLYALFRNVPIGEAHEAAAP